MMKNNSSIKKETPARSITTLAGDLLTFKKLTLNLLKLLFLC